MNNGIQLQYIYIPFTQFPIRKYYHIYQDTGNTVAHDHNFGSDNNTFILQYNGIDYAIDIAKVANRYLIATQISDEMNKALLLVPALAGQFKFAYEQAINKFRLDRVPAFPVLLRYDSSDIGKVLGFGDQPGVYHQL